MFIDTGKATAEKVAVHMWETLKVRARVNIKGHELLFIIYRNGKISQWEKLYNGSTDNSAWPGGKQCHSISNIYGQTTKC